MKQRTCTIFWTEFGRVYNSLKSFCYYNFFSEKGFRFWPKRSFLCIRKTKDVTNLCITSKLLLWVSLAVKRVIRITNEDMQLLSSLAILINSLDCQAHNRKFQVGMHKFVQAFVPLMHRKDNVNHNHLCPTPIIGRRPIAEWLPTNRWFCDNQSPDWFSNFNDDSKFIRRPIDEWLAIGRRMVCNWSATDCRSKIWSVMGWSMVVDGRRLSLVGDWLSL